MKPLLLDVLRLALMLFAIEMLWVMATGQFLSGQDAGWGDWL